MRQVITLVAILGFIPRAGADGLFSHLTDPDVLSVEQIIGMAVTTPEGRRLGRIEEFLFDPSTGIGVQVGVQDQRYPLSALVSSDQPGEVILEIPPSASAGGNALLPQLGDQGLRRAGRDALVDLHDGRLLPHQ